MREALAGLPDRDRLLLKLTIVSGLSHEQLANIYSVNQSTITRWIARAREQVLDATEREVCSKLGMPPGEFRSLAGLLVSRLDLSISRVLDTPRLGLSASQGSERAVRRCSRPGRRGAGSRR